MLLTHPIMVLFIYLRKLALEVQINGEVQIPIVAGVRLHLEHSVDLLALLDGQVFVKVEHRLLPVGVGGLRRGAEAQALVTLGELHVEIGDQRLNKVVSLHDQVERSLKIQIFLPDGVQVDLLDHVRAGDDLLRIDDIHQRFTDGHLPDRAHVETVHVVPPVDLLCPYKL